MESPCRPKDIKITRHQGGVAVYLDGKVIAQSTRAMDLDEPGAPLRVYLPRQDVDAALLEQSPTQTMCPYKGVASYYSLKSDGGVAKDAVWYYPTPCALAEPVRDHLAFWGDRIRYEFAA